MKVLKFIGIGLVILIAAFLLLGLFAPKVYHVERSTLIEAPKEMVFNQVVDLKNHPNWSPWQELDPEMVQTYEGPDGQVGQIVRWTGNKDVGKGSQEVKAVKANERVEIEVSFEEPFAAVNPSYFNVANEEGKTKVSWGMESKFAFPLNAMIVFMGFEKNIAKDFDKGLGYLKKYCEANKKVTPTFEVKKINWPGVNYLGKREEINMNNVTAYYEKYMSSIYDYVVSKKYEMAGMPSGLYYVWDPENEKVDLSAGIPLKGEFKVGKFEKINIPSQPALQIDYYGPYTNLMAPHEAMVEFLNTNSLTQVPPAIEEYITDPTTEPDTTKWLTKITYFYSQGE